MSDKAEITILVIDDQEENLDIISNSLKNTRYNVECVTNASSALEKLLFSPNKYQLILLDMMMPNMDGWEFIRNVKKTSRTDNIPVIIQSASASTMQIDEGIKAGAEIYLTKPYSKAQLIEAIDTTMAKYHKA